MKGYLVLENGSVYEGERIGKDKDAICEIVFNTSMVGYLENFTDPSYVGQGVVMTYPLIGNYGLTKEDAESKRPWVEAIFVHEIAEMESNFRSEMHLVDYLNEYDVPGLQGINTRKLTRELRNVGTMKGKLTSDISNIEDIIREIKDYSFSNLVEKVSSNEKYVLGNGKIKVALFDFGAKQNIINSLIKRDCEVTVFPWDTSYKEFLTGEFRGIVLSNGPGDPNEYQNIIENIKKLYEEANIPILGIGLGHQLMALATGMSVSKLKYGHRGASQPVKDLETSKVIITAQNHGYTVDENSIDEKIAKPSQININDGSVETLKYVEKDIVTLQYYPEETSPIYDEFIAKI